MIYFRLLLTVLLSSSAILSFSAHLSLAGSAGIYGVKGDYPQLSKYGIIKVFLPPDNEIITRQVASGRQVYLSLNIFGGSQPWKDYPDSIPVTSSGHRLSDEYGGICPTHAVWRKSRLKLLADWVRAFNGEQGISGIWLDFIRYPGKWEKIHHEVPDTCYCSRCLDLFQDATGIEIPGEIILVQDKASWINKHVRLEWMGWKKSNITSFVRDARKVVDQQVGRKKLSLGVFLVPWRKSDFEGAISYLLAQDADQFLPYIDVFSPMVYHKMVGQPVSWIGEITDYFYGMTGKSVWPIIQAEDVEMAEFRKVIEAVSNSEAEGLLVYTFSELHDEQWPLLKGLNLRENILQDILLTADGGVNLWSPPPVEKIQDSSFWVTSTDRGNALGVTAGCDQKGVWSTRLPECRQGGTYLFSGEFLRQDRSDAFAYPLISLWGHEYLLNTHRVTGKYQKLKVIVQCSEQRNVDDGLFQFRNDYRGSSFMMRNPRLVETDSAELVSSSQPVSLFFPIGSFGASSKNLEEMGELGFNAAILSPAKENIEACLAQKMQCILSMPREPENLINVLIGAEPQLKQGHFSYYVNDEPGIHSFPQWKSEDINRIIKKRFPEAATSMAVVRPQVIPLYEKSADYFMLDQYPIPNMPMSWLSESMDTAAAFVGRQRLQSVIQAFGGDKHAASGWPKLPTFEEMNCLAFLSVIHGSRGLFFYSFPAITSTEQGRNDLIRLIYRLNSMRSWLEVHNDKESVSLRMASAYRFDPLGNPAVHCTSKEQFNTKMLICVNTLHTHTETKIDISGERSSHWQEYFSGTPYMVAEGSLLARFKPLEVKVLIESK